MKTDATLSPCGKYRYSLTREWEQTGRRALFVMLNPSTADATLDDPTIRRCIAFSRSWGLDGIEVVNLFAWRATDPNELLAIGMANAVGPENDSFIHMAAGRSCRIVCAWGSHKSINSRVANVVKTLYFGSAGRGVPIECLGKTKNGSPKHPLYLKADTILQPYP